MTIRIKSNSESVLTLPGVGNLRPKQDAEVSILTPALTSAINRGLMLVPDGAPAEPENGLPPVLFRHVYPHVLPGKDTKVIREPGGFHDGHRNRDYWAVHQDGGGLQCAFSDDGVTWDGDRRLEGLTDPSGPFSLLKDGKGYRVFYQTEDGARTAISSRAPWKCMHDQAVTIHPHTTAWRGSSFLPAQIWTDPEPPDSNPDRPFSWRYTMYFIGSHGGRSVLGVAVSNDALDWHVHHDQPILSAAQDPQPWEDEVAMISSIHVEPLPDGRWWMLYGIGTGIGYAYSFDRVNWKKAAYNPVFRAGKGPFEKGCFAPCIVRQEDDSLLVYRTGFDGANYRTFVSRLRSTTLSILDLLDKDRLGQGLAPKLTLAVGSGSRESRDLENPIPELGDEWFNTQFSNGRSKGRWEKWTGENWKRT